MSRILVDQIRSNSASTDAITLDGSGNITIPGNATCSGTATGFGIGGKILQVLYTESTTGVTTTASRTELLTLAITPASSSNKVYVIGQVHAGANRNSNAFTMASLYRGTTYAEDLGNTELARGFAGTFDGSHTYDSYTLVALDSPNTSSAQTYALTFGKGSSGTNQAETDARYSLTLMEVAA